MEIAVILLMVVAVIAEPVKGCICTANYQPVCGRDGRTYNNACRARCSGVSVAHQGNCQETRRRCLCTIEFIPVCGTDGRTYVNACWARCSKVHVAYKGKCKHHINQSVEGMVGRTSTHAGRDAVACLWQSKAAVSLCKRR